MNKLKTVKEKVIDLLTKVPNLRDSDEKLIATIWNQEMGKDEQGVSKSKSTSAYCFFEALVAGKHTSAENIRRSRQKVQEQRPELRGVNYKERQVKGSQTRQQIHSL